MNENENNLIIVNMNDAEISTLESPIIGTRSLATCLGILLYDENSKRAIVAHVVSSNPMDVLVKIFDIISKNHLSKVKFKYKIFDGYYKDASEYYHTVETILSHFKDFMPLANVPEDAIFINHKYGSNEFYFNAITGEFVTSSILSLEKNNTKTR